LRNVTQTAPYGHSGAYDSLEAVIRHHLDPVEALHNYDASQLRMPSRSDLDARDLRAMNDPSVLADIANANELTPLNLNEHEISQLMDFLHALTDPAMLDLREDIPESLPSGLPLFD
jgi:cytochrome c peroxidase